MPDKQSQLIWNSYTVTIVQHKLKITKRFHFSNSYQSSSSKNVFAYGLRTTSKLGTGCIVQLTTIMLKSRVLGDSTYRINYQGLLPGPIANQIFNYFERGPLFDVSSPANLSQLIYLARFLRQISKSVYPSTLITHRNLSISFRSCYIERTNRA